MERLTNSNKEIHTLIDNAEYWQKVYFKLKEYEDLEKQGRLVKLPLADDKVEHRECVHTKATCHHEECKCSECPLTELFFGVTKRLIQVDVLLALN